MSVCDRLTSAVPRLAMAVLLTVVACGTPAAAPAQAPAAGSGAPPAAPAQGAAPPAAPAASAPTARADARPLSPAVPVKAGAYELTGNAGLFIAMDRGYFREEGLDVEPVDVRNTPDQLPQLATGDLHVGVGAVDPALFNAVARDIPIKIVGPVTVSRPQEGGSGLVIRKDLIDNGRYTGLKDLKGHVMARPAGGGLQQYYVDWLLDKAGLAPGDVETTVMTFPDMLPALGNRAIDSAILVEPFVSISEAQGTSKFAVSLGEMVPNLSILLLMMSPVFARDNPEAGKRFVTAWLRGQRDYWQAPRDEAARTEIVGILVKYLPIKDPALMARTISDSVALNGEIDERPLDDMQNYFVRLGTQPQRVDLSRMIDRSYLDYALERLGRR